MMTMYLTTSVEIKWWVLLCVMSLHVYILLKWSSDATALESTQRSLKRMRDEHAELQRRTAQRKKICLCGSTRFKLAYREWNARLTLEEAAVVLSVAMWSHDTRMEPTNEQKCLLDIIHLSKIDDADEIFVLDVGGYTGVSTKREIGYAIFRGKRVRYLSHEHPTWTEAECRYAS